MTKLLAKSVHAPSKRFRSTLRLAFSGRIERRSLDSTYEVYSYKVATGHHLVESLSVVSMKIRMLYVNSAGKARWCATVTNWMNASSGFRYPTYYEIFGASAEEAYAKAAKLFL